jgi:hypothetical protein
MKTLTLILTLATFVATAQTIRIADKNVNRPTGPNIFSTLQAAVDAALPGDIVYITPSLTDYGNVTISKRIKLVGVGFNTPELGGRFSGVNNITLLSSADGIVSTSNSEFSGFSFYDFTFAAGGVGSLPYNNILIEKVNGRWINYSGSPNTVNNLVIRNCVIQAIHINQPNNNTRIYQNVIQANVCCGNDAIYLNNATDALVTNNLFYLRTSESNIGLNILNSTNTRIEHNLFSGNQVVFRNLFNTPVVNNIFYGTNPATNVASNTFRDNVFSNNLVTPAQAIPPPANGGGSNSGIGNLTNLSPGFVNGPASATVWDASYDYSFPNTSPCYNASTSGDNIGPTGGFYPINKNIALKPSAIPIITLFGNTGVVPQNQPLKSNIKAKAN